MIHYVRSHYAPLKKFFIVIVWTVYDCVNIERPWAACLRQAAQALSLVSFASDRLISRFVVINLRQDTEADTVEIGRAVRLG